MSFRPSTNKDDGASSKGEISLLLREIDSLETKKQELLKTLSLYSSSFTAKPPANPSDTTSVKSFNSQNSQKTRHLKAKDSKHCDGELAYAVKADGANKPSHLYMALAKYLFQDPSAPEGDIRDEEELFKRKVEDLLSMDERSLLKTRSFDNESESVESVSTKDNFSISPYENSGYKQLLSPISGSGFPWSLKNQRLLHKYSTEHPCDWSKIAEKFNHKKLTPKMVKDHLSNKDQKPAEAIAGKRTRSRFTLSEDQKIINMIQKIGQNWRDIAKALPGRTEGMVKNRFYSHIKRKYFALVQSSKPGPQLQASEEETPAVEVKGEHEKSLLMNLEGLVERDEALVEMRESDEKGKDGNPEFLAFFDEGKAPERMDFEEDFEFNLLKTPETEYNFDDYNNALVKVTPFEKEEGSLMQSGEKSEELSSYEVDENTGSTKKLKIRLLSGKIEDIEHLLQQTKVQINKLYGFE